MKLRSFLKSFHQNKTSQFKGGFSYHLLEYVSGDKKHKEIVWNGTNLNPPAYILDKSKKFKLYLTQAKELIPYYQPQNGERFFSYKSPETYLQERKPILQFYWDQNYLECQKNYSSYEEFFAISCKSMNKSRIELRTKL